MDATAQFLLYVLMLVLPLSALLARRLPTTRALRLVLIWIAIFSLAALLVGWLA